MLLCSHITSEMVKSVSQTNTSHHSYLLSQLSVAILSRNCTPFFKNKGKEDISYKSDKVKHNKQNKTNNRQTNKNNTLKKNKTKQSKTTTTKTQTNKNKTNKNQRN